MSENDQPIVFTFPPYEDLVPSEQGKFSIEKFPNKEICLTVETPVRGRHCYIVGSLSPPESSLFSMLVLSHTLKKEGAKKISAFIPYLAYSRQEKFEAHKSRIAALVGKLLKASGVDEVLTVDVHSSLIHTLFPIPVCSYSTAPLFAQILRELDLKEMTLVAPDRGALPRCKAVGKSLGLSPDSIAWIQKVRKEGEVQHVQFHGAVHGTAILIDDILDTGKTLLSACYMLRSLGVKQIVIMVTHGLFSGDAWKELASFGVQKIYCTDTVPLSAKFVKENTSTLVSIKPILNILRGDIWKK